jgi:hypothetical protein
MAGRSWRAIGGARFSFDLFPASDRHPGAGIFVAAERRWSSGERPLSRLSIRACETQATFGQKQPCANGMACDQFPDKSDRARIQKEKEKKKFYRMHILFARTVRKVRFFNP